MAYDTSKLITLGQLKALAQKVKSEDDGLNTRITALEEAGYEENVIEKVQVNGADLPIASKAVNILIAEGGTNGTIKVNNVDIDVHGLAALAFKSEVAKADLASALAEEIDDKVATATFNTLDDKVTTLIGTDANKSVRTIANEELAAQLIPGDAQESLDTLAEIAAWIQSHPEDAAAMHAAITALQNKTVLGTYESGGEQVEYDTVKAYVEAIQSAINSDLDGKVDKETGKGLSANDFTDALKTKLDGVTAGATKVEASETNGNIKINDVETTVYTEPSDVVHGAIATDTENNEMLTEVFGA